MILVDTSVWIAHFATGVPQLAELLEAGDVFTHPFVIGELACGRLRRRSAVLDDLAQLPQATPAHHDDVLHVLQQRNLYGKGIGWVDAHLLATAVLSDCRLWTLDRALSRVATDVSVAF